MLTESVPDSHLAALRSERISYIFAGTDELDLERALMVLNQEVGLKRIALQGGGSTNSTFLGARLINEISLVIFPAIDGTEGAPSVFENRNSSTEMPTMSLLGVKELKGGAVWLRYELENNPS